MKTAKLATLSAAITFAVALQLVPLRRANAAREAQPRGAASKTYEVTSVFVGGKGRRVFVQVGEDGARFDAEKIERNRARAVKELTEAEASAESSQASAQGESS